MKKIAILTRDCAGVNAAIRSIVRTASDYNIEVIGVMRGYDGLIDNDFNKLLLVIKEISLICSFKPWTKKIFFILQKFFVFNL